MLVTTICLLQLFSQLQPARGETTGELMESVGKLTQTGSNYQITCSFNVQVTLSRVDFLHTSGSRVFAIVDCGGFCRVRSTYQDVLHIESPKNTISGDYFVFSALRSDNTTGTYTCHGIPITPVASPTPPGTGDGAENQKTSTTPPETDKASHDAGGSGNGLLALLIIPILLVLAGVVLFLLYRRGVIKIPCLRKNGRDRQQPFDLMDTLWNLLQPVTRCWTRIRHHSQSTQEDHETTNQDEEHVRYEDKEIREIFVHHRPAERSPLLGKVGSDESKEENTDSKEHQALIRDSSIRFEPTQEENIGVEERQPLQESSPLSSSTKAKNENGGVEEGQVSSNSSLISNSIEVEDENGGTEELPALPESRAASLSRDVIACKDESADSTRQTFASGLQSHGTRASGDRPAAPPRSRPSHGNVLRGTNVPPYSTFSTPSHGKDLQDDRSDSTFPLQSPLSVTGHGKPEDENDDIDLSSSTSPKPRNAEKKNIRQLGVSVQQTPNIADSKVETEGGEIKDINHQSNTERNKEEVKEKEEREGERTKVEMEERGSKEAKSETENNENTKLKQERGGETMAAKAEREHQEEAALKMENTKELNAVEDKKQSKDMTTETKEELAANVNKEEDSDSDQSSSGSSDDVDSAAGTSLSFQPLTGTGAASADDTPELPQKRNTIQRLSSKLSGITSLYTTDNDDVNV